MAFYLIVAACIAVAVANPAGNQQAQSSNYGSHGSSSSNYGGGSAGYSGHQTQGSSSAYSGGQSSAGSYSGGQSSGGAYSGGQSSGGAYSGGQSSGGAYSGSQGGYSGGRQSSAPVVPILHQDGNVNPDGSYKFSYETGDYSARQEEADSYNYVRGSYNYVAPDGQKITVTYTADENGFVPYGAHLPTPVPSPYPFNMIIGGQGGQYGGSQSAPQYGGASQGASQYGGSSQGAPQYGGAQQSAGNDGY